MLSFADVVVAPDSRSLSHAARAVARFVLGPRDTWLPALALLLPALVWLSLEGRAYPAFEPYAIGDYAKIELYTRLAAEGSQRVGTESRFHIHQPGPSFFYAVAPVYVLLGETTLAMGVASLLWNGFFLLALLRSASRLAPGQGPFVAAVALAAFLHARGLGLLASSFNPHAGLLPFGVALLASARLATGEARALPLLVLAGSVVLQCQFAWVLGVTLPALAGLLLLVVPPARRALRIPSLGPGLTRGSVAAAVLVASALWALPVIDEFTGQYRNFHRMLAMRERPRTPTPWPDTLRPAAEALSLERPAPSPLAAVLVTPSLLLCGWLAARRRAPTTALAVVAAVGVAAVPIVVRYMPGKNFPTYLFAWGSMVTLGALLVVGVELAARAEHLRGTRWLTAALLVAVSVVPLAEALASSPPLTTPRDKTSVAVEHLARQIQARAAIDVPAGRRFRMRVAPSEDQAGAIGLILALDKAGLRFGVEPFGSCRVEGRFTPRGDEWAELIVGDPAVRDGARNLGLLGGRDVTWRRLWTGGSPGGSPR